MSELAEKLIAENLRTKNPVLDLGNCGLDGTEDELYKPLRDARHLESVSFTNEWWDREEQVFVTSANADIGKNNVLTQIPESIPITIKEFLLAGEYDWKIQNFSFLGRFENLEILNISSNHFTNISFLENLSSLKRLHLSYNPTIQDYTPLKKLKNLQNLDIGNNDLKDISFLQNLNTLSNLDIGDNEIEDISFLENLTNLQILDIGDNHIKNYTVLGNLTKLKSLDLRDSNNIQEEDLSFLSSISSLQELFLGGGGGSVEFRDLSFLKGMTKLNSLDLSNSKITDITIFKDLQDLKILNICYNEIKDISMLQYLHKLEELRINGNQVQDISVLKSLVKLKNLELQDNPIQNIEVLESLESLSNIKLSFELLPYPSIWYAYFKAKGNKISNYTHLPELPDIEKIWQIMQNGDEENINLAHQLAMSQGWTEEEFEMYQKLL